MPQELLNPRTSESSPELFREVELMPGVKGILIVDRFISNRAVGGIRMLSDVAPEELQILARAMTLKYGFLGIALGGAKAGITLDPECPDSQREEALRKFGEVFSDVLKKRIYIPGPDMGTGNQDIQKIIQAAGIPCADKTVSHSHSGFFTALTVLTAAKCAAKDKGLDLRNASIAIEGFGNVGSVLAEFFFNQGAKVIAVSNRYEALYNPQGLDIPELVRLCRLKGNSGLSHYMKAERISLSHLLELDADILSPCARHHAIHAENAPKIKAQMIIPGANAAFTDEAEKIIFEQGRLCMPDFVANSGGVLSGALASMGLDETFTTHFIETLIASRMSYLIVRAKEQGISVSAAARIIAQKRFDRMKTRAEKKSWASPLFQWGGILKSKGLLPAPLLRIYGKKHFQKVCAEYEFS